MNIIIVVKRSFELFSVTKFDVHLINTIVCYVCVVYTLLGGIKAVVWTDVGSYSTKYLFVKKLKRAH